MQSLTPNQLFTWSLSHALPPTWRCRSADCNLLSCTRCHAVFTLSEGHDCSTQSPEAARARIYIASGGTIGRTYWTKYESTTARVAPISSTSLDSALSGPLDPPPEGA
jgi:hypothetical protein